MNEGFFSSEYLVVKKKLPPVLKVKVPEEVKKASKDKKVTAGKQQMTLDIESYPNYFLVKFRNENDGKYIKFEMINGVKQLDCEGIKKILRRCEIFTYNGLHYDIPILQYALQYDCTTEDLKELSNELIKTKITAWKFQEKYELEDIKGITHVDIKPLCPVGTSLKLCGARLHCKKLQELPYPEETVLTDKQISNVDTYNDNDLDVTSLLKDNLTEEIELRRMLSKRYDIDLMSKSDAQIAEGIIKTEVFNRTDKYIKKQKDLHMIKFLYQMPDFISFVNPKLNEVLDILKNNEFIAKPVVKGIKAPKEFEGCTVKIGNTTYQMGIGGLHSKEKLAYHLSDDEYDLWDWDVKSYYPEIMIQCGLYPKSVGRTFLPIFKEIKDERIKAKDSGDTVKANSLKITINGTFGKTGSPYSILYAPELMIQVTITGQLSLLMLIDLMERRGFEIVSGNTDGIVVKCKHGREEEMKKIIHQWEKRTGFSMESANYAGLYSRDVNNYIAIEHNGKVKLKGCFAYAKRGKNPEHDICTDALIAYLKYGTPVENTIRACRDIRKFISIQQVKGGAVKNKKYLGKVVRWYYSTEESGIIEYKTNGSKVALTDGAKPIMTLPGEFPDDVNYKWYENRCRELFYMKLKGNKS